MKCWEILGIKQTEDSYKVKKAYSAAIKLHHPEDDPEGFQQVRKAYQDALQYIKKQTIYLEDEADFETKAEKDLKGEIENKGEIEKNKAENIEFDFEIIAAKKDKSDVKIRDKKEDVRIEAVFDFTNLPEEGMLKTEEQRKALIRKISFGYINKPNSLRYWRALFSSKEFLDLQMDDEFLDSFLKFIASNRRFSGKIWNRVFVTMIKEWSYLWVGSNYEVMLLNVLPKMKKGFYDKGWSEPKNLVIFVLKYTFFALFLFAIVISLISQPNTEIDPISLLNNQNIEEPFYQKVNKQEPSTQLILYNIILGGTYEEAEETYKDYHITKMEYESLCKAYKEQGITYIYEFLLNRSNDIKAEGK